MGGSDTGQGEVNGSETTAGGSEARASETVEFGALREALREHQYPVTTAELIEMYGSFEFEGPEGVDRLEPALTRVEETTFRKPADVRDAVIAGLTDGGAYGDEGTELSPAAGDWSRLSV